MKDERMKVDMNLLKQLRDTTQAPLKDCKEALVESDGDIDKAQSILREKWAAKAAKKSWRETNEGILKFKKIDDKVVWIKLLCETDFVAKNENFHELADLLVDELGKMELPEWDVLNINDIGEDFVKSKLDPIIQDYIIKIWENVSVFDVFVWRGNCYIYTHPGNKVVSLVFYDCKSWGCEEVAKEVALQVAAMDPLYKDIQEIPEEEKEKMREDFKKEFEWSWKPQDIVEKIVEWKLMKSFSENVLTEQLYIRDDSKKMKEIFWDNFLLTSFKRFSI